MADDRGAPIAYTVLAEGTAVRSADGEDVGTVVRVLADEATDVFDGIVVDAGGRERFVDAPHVDEVFERLVTLDLTGDEVRRLAAPEPAPAVVDVAPDDLAGASGRRRRGDTVRRWWDRLVGRW